jgi:hypothetical protein
LRSNLWTAATLRRFEFWKADLTGMNRMDWIFKVPQASSLNGFKRKVTSRDACGTLFFKLTDFS